MGNNVEVKDYEAGGGGVIGDRAYFSVAVENTDFLVPLGFNPRMQEMPCYRIVHSGNDGSARAEMISGIGMRMAVRRAIELQDRLMNGCEI